MNVVTADSKTPGRISFGVSFLGINKVTYVPFLFVCCVQYRDRNTAGRCQFVLTNIMVELYIVIRIATIIN